MKSFITVLVFSLSLISCISHGKSVSNDEIPAPENYDSYQVAYFASGCFWCVEAIFESVEGVQEAVSGYSGGVIENPTYEQVSSGRTKHAETVKVYYDSTKVSFETLVDVFFNSHDPTTLNQQGPDKGPQYRSIAFYNNAVEKRIIDQKIKHLLSTGVFPEITTEVVKFNVFYIAEAYHQNYERLHPENGYIKAVSIPRLNAFKAKMPKVLKAGAHH